MIVADAIRKVQAFTRDDGTFVTQVDVRDWLNEALVDLAARLNLFDREVLATTTAATIPYPGAPANVVRVISLELGAGYVDEVTFVAADVFDQYQEQGGDPGLIIARVFNETFELHPAPAVGTPYRLRYKRIPVLMSVMESEIGVPIELERKLLEYAKWAALMKLGRTDDARDWYSLYENALPSPALGKERTLPGPLTFARAPNAWDLDPDASHV